MQRTICWFAVAGLIMGLLAVGCSKETDVTSEEPTAEEATTAEEPTETAATVEEESLPDPGPEEAKLVEDFVQQWVAERTGEGDVYDIPPHAGYDVAGTLGDFHTVHQKDADTYSVCVDFIDEADTYDVDFFVARTADGLSVSDHYLHKVNGEVVE